MFVILLVSHFYFGSAVEKGIHSRNAMEHGNDPIVLSLYLSYNGMVLHA